MELSIRPVQQNDFNEIFNLLQQLWTDLELDYNLLLKVYNKAVESKVQKMIVGEIGNKIIGFCSLTIRNNLLQAGNLGHLDELVIDKEYCGNGFGKQMIESITEIAQGLDCNRIELDTAFYRKESHEFYESIGYKKKSYLFTRKLD